MTDFPVIASEAACAREAGYGDLLFLIGDLRSKPVLGLETGTINPVIASEARRSGFFNWRPSVNIHARR